MPVGFAPLPRGPQHNGTFFFSDGWLMHSQADNKEAARLWLKFIAANPANSARFSQLTGRVPAMIRALASYRNALPDEVLHPEVVANVIVAPTTRTGETQHPRIDDIYQTFAAHFNSIRLGHEAPETALNLIQAQAELLLNAK